MITFGGVRARVRHRWRSLVPVDAGEMRLPIPVRRALLAAGVEVGDRDAAVAAVAGLGAACLVGAALGSVAGAVVAVVAVTVAGAAVLWLQRGRTERLLVAAIPDLVEAMARSLRSGASPTRALVEARAVVAAPLRRDLDTVVARTRRGVSFTTALAQWRDARRSHAVDLAVAALTLGSTGGGDRARGLDGVAATLRERRAIDAEVAASSAQARASAAVVAVLPVGFGIIAAAGDAEVAETLLHTTPGRVCLLAGLALDAIGAVWMLRIVRGPR